VGANVLKPVGFWSYARQDDSHSDGQLTQLRAIVGNAISLRVGDEVKLFQDTAAIPFGADWAANIEEAIDQTTFFIPIVTPRFLKSENCRDEFRSFRRRMKALGRNDLIFPIHYVDVESIAAASDTVFGDELGSLRRQQWIDFRPLQFEDVKSAKVRQWADALAASIHSAIAVTPRVRPKETLPSTYGGSTANLQPRPPASPAAVRRSLPIIDSLKTLSVFGLALEWNLNPVFVKTILALLTYLILILGPYNNYDLSRLTFNYKVSVLYFAFVVISAFVRTNSFLSFILFLVIFYWLYIFFPDLETMLPNSWVDLPVIVQGRKFSSDTYSYYKYLYSFGLPSLISRVIYSLFRA
jgi:hypothetical protein